MTRRQFGAGVGAMTIAAPHKTAATTTIDQNPIRRRGTGLRGFDPSRASPGFTLFAPASCDGTVYLELPAEIAAKIRGGRPGTKANGKIWADYLVEVTRQGETVWEWRDWDHLDPAEFPIAVPEPPAEWTHGNAVVELADGTLMVSFRNISTIVRIDRGQARSYGRSGPQWFRASTRPHRSPMETS